MEIKTDISLQTKQVLSQVQMQSLNILSMSMTELEEFLQNEEIENPLVEYSSGRQEGELPVAYREYDPGFITARPGKEIPVGGSMRPTIRSSRWSI